MERLLVILGEQGFRICYSLIVEDNTPSVRMHEKLGFTECGFAANTGYKFGAWHGIITMEQQLNVCSENRSRVFPVPKLNYADF